MENIYVYMCRMYIGVSTHNNSDSEMVPFEGDYGISMEEINAYVKELVDEIEFEISETFNVSYPMCKFKIKSITSTTGELKIILVVVPFETSYKEMKYIMNKVQEQINEK